MLINDREFKIVVPKYDNSGNKIKPEVLESIAKEMSEHFGGVTIYPSVLGCWVNKDGKITCEENAVFESIRDSESTKRYPSVVKNDEEFINGLAERLGKTLGQYSIMTSESKVEVNFIKGKYLPSLPKSMVGHDWFRKLL